MPQQKARRHALASPPLVASDEMTSLGPADRRPAPSQKLPTSKQPTPPAAPASAPPLSSASIAPSSLFLNLLSPEDVPQVKRTNSPKLDGPPAQVKGVKLKERKKEKNKSASG